MVEEENYGRFVQFNCGPLHIPILKHTNEKFVQFVPGGIKQIHIVLNTVIFPPVRASGMRMLGAICKTMQ